MRPHHNNLVPDLRVHARDLGNDVVGVGIVLVIPPRHLHRQRHRYLLLEQPRHQIVVLRRQDDRWDGTFALISSCYEERSVLTASRSELDSHAPTNHQVAQGARGLLSPAALRLLGSGGRCGGTPCEGAGRCEPIFELRLGTIFAEEVRLDGPGEDDGAFETALE